MSYMTLGQLGIMLPPKPVVPGTAEVANLKAMFEAGIKAGFDPNVDLRSVPCCVDMDKDRWHLLMKKYEEMELLYPEALKANPIMCNNTTSIPRYFPPISVKAYYDEYLRSKTVNLDMTPAVNTVPDGTPGSWNVTGTQKSGSMYSYNFGDKAAAQTYAQAVVDSGGTATMYQVPVASTPSGGTFSTSPIAQQLNTVVSTSIPYQGPVTTGGTPTPPDVYVPPQTVTMTPDQMYANPVLPEQAAPVAQQKSNVGLMAALIAVPAAAAWWFFHK